MLLYMAGRTAASSNMAYLPNTESLRKALWLPTPTDEVNQLDENNSVGTKLCYQNGRSCSSQNVETLTRLRERYASNANTEKETLKTFSITLAPNGNQNFDIVCTYMFRAHTHECVSSIERDK